MSLLRTMARKVFATSTKILTGSARPIHHLNLHKQSHDELDERYRCYFLREDIDGWDIRQAMNDLCGMDMVPEPAIIISALYACRRINDYALAIRFMEAIKDKCGNRVDKIYPYILQEIAPTLCELGIDTLEELGFDKPELHLQNVYDM